jgi:hypothetical protein
MRILLLVLAVGCAEELGRPDGGMVVPDAGPTISFEAETIGGPSLVFENAVLSAERLEVDLTAHGLSRVFGLAYRIEYDPNVLSVDALVRSEGFIHDDLFQVKESEPGRLVVAMSAVGPHRGIDLDGTPVARLGLMRKNEALTEIRIVRPFGLDEDGGELFYRAGKGAIVER